MSIFDNTDFAGSTIDVPVGETTITYNGTRTYHQIGLSVQIW